MGDNNEIKRTEEAPAVSIESTTIEGLLSKYKTQVNELLSVKVESHGAHEGVTGSATVVSIKREGKDVQNILIDFGSFQGQRDADMERNRVLPFSAGNIAAVVNTHQHIDHCGRLPLLIKGSNKVRNGDEIIDSKKRFEGSVFTSHVGQKLLDIMLNDSVDVMTKEAEKRIRNLEADVKKLKEQAAMLSTLQKILNKEQLKGSHLKMKSSIQKLYDISNNGKIKRLISEIKEKFRKAGIKDVNLLDEMFSNTKKLIESSILYNSDDVARLVSQGKGTKYEKINELIPSSGIFLVFNRAEHVFGSCIATLIVDDGKGGYVTLGFSGDVGRFFENKYLNQPDIPGIKIKDADGKEKLLKFTYDFFMCESTYGGREHANRDDEKLMMAEIINRTYKRGGKVIFPTFMLQRLQDVGNLLLEMQDEGLIPKDMQVYFDGASSEEINNIYLRYDKDLVYQNLGNNERFKYAEDKDAGKNLFIESKKPCIICSPSGMYAGGAITKYNDLLNDGKNTLIFPGFVGEGTPGRRILEIAGLIAKPGLTQEEAEGVVKLAADIEKKLRLPGSVGETTLNAEVHQMKSLSSHGDQEDILYLLSELKFKKDGIIYLNHGDQEAKSALAEAIRKMKIIKPYNVFTAAPSTHLSKITDGKWEATKIKRGKNQKPLVTKTEFEHQAGLDYMKLQAAIRAIFPNEGFSVRGVVTDFAAGRRRDDSFTQKQMAKSNNPAVREFRKNPYKKKPVVEKPKKAEPAPVLEEKMVKDAVKDVVEIGLASVGISIIKIANSDQMYYAKIKVDGKLVLQTRGDDFEVIKAELINSGIIPEDIEITKSSITFETHKETLEKGLITLKQGSSVEKKKSDFIDIKFRKEKRTLIGTIVYKGISEFDFKGNKRTDIYNALVRECIIDSDYVAEHDKVVLSETNVDALLFFIEKIKKEKEDAEKAAHVKKHRKRGDALPLGKSSKRYTGEKKSRREKKKLEKK